VRYLDRLLNEDLESEANNHSVRNVTLIRKEQSMKTEIARALQVWMRWGAKHKFGEPVKPANERALLLIAQIAGTDGVGFLSAARLSPSG